MAKLILLPGEIHVWRASLSLDPLLLDRLKANLSPQERERGSRLYFPLHSRYFFARYGILRDLLSFYTKTAPDRLIINHFPGGKPLLANQPAQEPLNFSLSSSESRALFAFCLERRIGVDIEAIPANKSPTSLKRLARYTLAPSELERFQTLPLKTKKTALYKAWTRKEAGLKALGSGLAISMHQLTVSFLTDQEPLRIQWDYPKENNRPGEESSRWSLRDLTLDQKWPAALATDSSSLRLVTRTWSSPLGLPSSSP